MFWAYAKHEQEKEDMINKICELARRGVEINVTLTPDDYFSLEDIKYIEREVRRRLEIC